jgi:GINS complex subunit 1
MNYGQYGRDLLLELQRSNGTGNSASEPKLTAYNDETVRNCLQDLKLHVQALQDQVQANSGDRSSNSSGSQSQSQSPAAAPPPGNGKPSLAVRPSILLQNAAIQRNKRCLLTYHVARIERIKEHLYWKQQQQQDQQQGQQQKENATGTGTGTAAAANSGGRRQVLCPAEQDWLSDYSALVDRYTAGTGLPPGTLLAYTVPPEPADRVLIRVVQAAPEFCGGDAICLPSGATACLVMGSTHFLFWSDVEEYLRAGYLQLLEGEEEGR